MDGYKQMTIWDYLSRDADIPNEDVPIEGVVNLKSRPISNYNVRLAYGDLTLIIAVLRDYVRGLDKLIEQGESNLNPMEYTAYYRKKFIGIADKISEQIEYDYDEKYKKCLKKMEKESNSDIGEEALALALKRA